MASTNKTTHYELSQFLGTDKPAWLGDYNPDMNKIDTAIYTAQNTATAADGKATSNTTAIGDLTNLSTTVKTDLVSAINEVDGKAGTAQNTANVAVNNSIDNKQSISKIADILNINTYLSYTSANLTATNGTIGSGELYVARNADGSLFKVYGNILFTSSGAGECAITIPNTGIVTDTPYTIQGCGYAVDVSSPIGVFRPLSIDVRTDGSLRLKTSSGAVERTVFRPIACLYFNSDFGDVTPD